MNTTRNTYSYLTIVAIIAIGAPLAFVWTRQHNKQASAPAKPSPVQITTTAGDGVTATYQVQEEQSKAAGSFTVKPSEAAPGARVTLEWNVPDAEKDSVRIEGVDSTFATEGVWPTKAPQGGEAFETHNATSATTDTHIYRLEAKRKGGGEPIKLEAKLKIVPNR